MNLDRLQARREWGMSGLGSDLYSEPDLEMEPESFALPAMCSLATLLAAALACPGSHAAVFSLDASAQASQFRPVVTDTFMSGLGPYRPVVAQDGEGNPYAVGSAGMFHASAFVKAIDTGINMPQAGGAFSDAQIEFVDNAALRALLGDQPDLELWFRFSASAATMAPEPFGIWRQALAHCHVSVNVISQITISQSGYHTVNNGSYDHTVTNSPGLFEGLPEPGGTVQVAVPIVIKPDSPGGLQVHVSATASSSALSLSPPAFAGTSVFVPDPSSAITLVAGDPVSQLGVEYEFQTPTLAEELVTEALEYKRSIAPMLLASHEKYSQFSTLKSVLAPMLSEVPPVAAKFWTDQVLSTATGALIRMAIEDPPDPAYQEIYVPVVPVVPIEGLDALPSEQAALFRKSTDLNSQFTSTLQASLVTLERAGAAVGVGDWAWAEAHNHVLETYVWELEELAGEIAVVEEDLADVISTMGVSVGMPDLADVQAFQATLMTEGLPEEERQILDLFGLDEQDIAPELEVLANTDVSALLGSSLSQIGSEAPRFREYAERLAYVPEPPTPFLLGVSALVFCTYAWRKRR